MVHVEHEVQVLPHIL